MGGVALASLVTNEVEAKATSRPHTPAEIAVRQTFTNIANQGCYRPAHRTSTKEQLAQDRILGSCVHLHPGRFYNPVLPAPPKKNFFFKKFHLIFSHFGGFLRIDGGAAEPVLAAPETRPCFAGPRSLAQKQSARGDLFDVALDDCDAAAEPQEATRRIEEASARRTGKRTTTAGTCTLIDDEDIDYYAWERGAIAAVSPLQKHENMAVLRCLRGPYAMA